MAKTDSRPYSFRLKKDVGYALDDLVAQWGCNQTEAVERALSEMRDLVMAGGEVSAPTSSPIPSTFRKVAEIPGIQVGAADLPKNATCRHCPNRFAGSRFATICSECQQNGHFGQPADCGVCGESGTGGL